MDCEKVMITFRTKREDWCFLLAAIGIPLFVIYITSWDLLVIQKLMLHIGILWQAGLILTLSGIILRQLARKALGRHFSYALRIIRNHELEKNGIYRYVRHPAYTGFILTVLGTPLIFSSLYGVLVALSIIPAIMSKIRIEEKMLVEEFGVKYLDYAKQTKKLIPHIY